MLFVCQGNICRSPFAAARAADLLSQAGLPGDPVCVQAGIKATQAARAHRGKPTRPPRSSVSRFAGHRPLQLTQTQIAKFDVTITMDATQMRALGEQYPRMAGRIFLLSLLDPSARGGYERYNIADPFGQPAASKRRCYQRIDAALNALVPRLTPAGSSSSGSEVGRP